MAGKKQWSLVLALTVGVFISGITISQAQMELQLDLPLGLEKESLVIPEDNPLTREKVELGKLLFFDKRLSANNTIACASCHIPALAFTDGQPVSTGIHRQQGGGGHQRPLTGPSAQLNFGTAAQPRWKNSR